MYYSDQQYSLFDSLPDDDSENPFAQEEPDEAGSNAASGDSVLKVLMQQLQVTTDSLKQLLSDRLSFDYTDLPDLRWTDGTFAASEALAMILVFYDNVDELAPLVAQVDHASLMSALLKTADLWINHVKNLWYKLEPLYLFYPICRYGDEPVMEAMGDKVYRWLNRSYTPSKTYMSFMAAALQNDTITAARLEDAYGTLGEYAELRGFDEDGYRDLYLCDSGLDERCRKTYDLGAFSVDAVLQPDLSLKVAVPGSKKLLTSIPYEGADPRLYASAAADFNELRGTVRYIVGSRLELLKKDFLTGRARDAESWQSGYLRNPLLRAIASTLVWCQGENTFILTEDGPVCADGSAYTITPNPGICVAHPFDMTPAAVDAWKEFLRSHKIKQPFEQIGEPVYALEEISPDRYKGCEINWRLLQNREADGIHIEEGDWNWAMFGLEDCVIIHEMHNNYAESISPKATFLLFELTIQKTTRQANHIIYLFDQWTGKSE